ncbi:transcription antitermination factor NusB [Salaquimonas pukyongi]|uniref:transcription antitermination factor NusB n=1 Tax=Salaquimonas pukyongi TaxID=2712698 RepID=UPI00096B8F22|nr:transcription antitermination factor NusB [Salaquimonas pukyongi]
MAEPAPQLSKAANKRGVARLAAVQALYQMDLTSARLMDVVAEFENFRLGKEVDPGESPEIYREADPQWFRAVLSGVLAEQRQIDPVIAKNLPPDWPLARIETLLRAVLRAGAWELIARKDVPAKVVINEYVDVARAFFEEDEHKLVNGVLDRIARTSRDELLAEPVSGSPQDGE